MAKIKIANSLIDSALESSGLAKVVNRTSNNDARIQNSNEKKIKIKVTSSRTIEDSEQIYEVAKIKVTSVDGKQATISSALSSGRTILNHISSIPKMVDLNTSNMENITPATPTYSVNANFNYISEDYDVLQTSIPEHNLNCFFDECTKNEIINFKKLKNAKLSNFSRGDQMKNFVAPSGFSDKFSKSCPYSISINLNDGIEGGISKFLQKISIYDELLNDYLKSNKKTVRFNIQSGMVTSQEVEVMGYDVSSFFGSNIEIDKDNFYGLNRNESSSKMSYDFRKHLLKGYLKATTKTGFRTYSDILSNVECYKEAMCYSIEKFEDFDLDSTRLQNIYVTSDQMTTTFTDTQIKYGKTYVYRVKAHHMIVGNSYSYRNIRYYNEDGVVYATAEVVNKPSIMIMPFDLFSETKTIIEPPPVSPQVTFRTENNSENEIQIYLSPTKNEVESRFLEITEQDSAQRELMEQFYSKRKDVYRFYCSVSSGLFEAFRLSYPPKELSDFSNSKLGEIRMPFRSTDAILRDKVESNKDYYYIFRQLNHKEMVSNPTSVFKVRLVVDADDARVIVDTYEFPKPKMSEPRRDFKSMMQIKPAVEQVLFIEEQDALYNKSSLKGTIDELKLGTQLEAVWGRKFKLRVRSKTSGKMIDININFELAKNKTKEEF